MEDDGSIKDAYWLNEPGSDRLALMRRWLDELEGKNRKDAFELLNLVMAGKISNEEAFTLLDNMHN